MSNGRSLPSRNTARPWASCLLAWILAHGRRRPEGRDDICDCPCLIQTGSLFGSGAGTGFDLHWPNQPPRKRDADHQSRLTGVSQAGTRRRSGDWLWISSSRHHGRPAPGASSASERLENQTQCPRPTWSCYSKIRRESRHVVLSREPAQSPLRLFDVRGCTE
jgi:hypothetical protein